MKHFENETRSSAVGNLLDSNSSSKKLSAPPLIAALGSSDSSPRRTTPTGTSTGDAAASTPQQPQQLVRHETGKRDEQQGKGKQGRNQLDKLLKVATTSSCSAAVLATTVPAAAGGTRKNHSTTSTTTTSAAEKSRMTTNSNTTTSNGNSFTVNISTINRGKSSEASQEQHQEPVHSPNSHQQRPLLLVVHSTSQQENDSSVQEEKEEVVRMKADNHQQRKKLSGTKDIRREKLARNRFLAQCRRKEKRRQLETTKKKIKDLHLQNEELKRLNRQLLQELLDHGADFLQADAPPSCVAR